MYTAVRFALWELPDKATPIGSASTKTDLINLLRNHYKVSKLDINAISALKVGEDWGEVFQLKQGRGSHNVIIKRTA